MLMELSRGCQ